MEKWKSNLVTEIERPDQHRQNVSQVGPESKYVIKYIP